jgi:glycosyltransferase involved in cell wall biosynthesis
MRETYRATRGIVPRKVFTIPNWTDESRFERLPKRADICARFGIPAERFIFLYLGNIGPLAGVELLIEAFHAAEIEQAQMVIAGDGSSKAKCLELVERLGTQEIRFISCPDVHSVAAIQSMADVFLLPIRKGGGMSSIPSKLPSYLFSSRPVLSTLDADCDTARCIREANCGWIGEPENVAWLSAKMTEVAMTPAPVLDAMGQRGRAYGLKHFSKAEGVKRLAAVVLAAGASKAAPRTRPKN